MAVIMLNASSVPQDGDDQDGIWTTLSGKKLLLCHADQEGYLDDNATAYVEKYGMPDIIVSCYPKAVASRWNVQTIGTWDGQTTAYIYPFVDDVRLHRKGVFGFTTTVELYHGCAMMEIHSADDIGQS